MRKEGEIQKSNRENGKDEHTVYIYGNVIIELITVETMKESTES